MAHFYEKKHCILYNFVYIDDACFTLNNAQGMEDTIEYNCVKQVIHNTT